MTSPPCIYIEHLSDEQKRAYVLADNQIALYSTWDENLLADELKALSNIDLGFEIESTGFSIAEIDMRIGEAEPEEDHDPNDDIVPLDVAARVRHGDIWQLGNHRLICGDSLDADVINRLMSAMRPERSRGSAQEPFETATTVFTDPPYNVKIDGHVGGKGKIKHQEFAMASGGCCQTNSDSSLNAYQAISMRHTNSANLRGIGCGVS